jgi:hypothetical protein
MNIALNFTADNTSKFKIPMTTIKPTNISAT